MRVWHITRSMYGGAGIYARRLSDSLRDEGLESTVLCVDMASMGKSSPPANNCLKSVGGIVPQFASRVVRSMSHRMTVGPFHSLLGQEVYKSDRLPRKGDIIHLHGLTGWMGLRGLNTLIPKDSQVYWTTHDLWPLSGGCILYSGCHGYQNDCGSCPILRTGFKRWAKLELQLKERLIMNKNIQPIANSNWMASHVYGSRVFKGVKVVPVIPPIVASSYFAADINSIREQLDITPGKKVVSLGARSITDRYKGIPEFLDALAKRSDLVEQCVILLFGEGDLELPDNLDVRVLGRLNSTEELARVYASSDVFVSPSAMETFGMALAEAQACGTPVVAFDAGGVSDAVSEECAKFLVKDGGMDALLDTLTKVFEQSSEKAKSWQVGRKWARDRFEAAVVARQQIKVYQTY